MDNEEDAFAMPCRWCGLDVDPECECMANEPVNVGDELHQILGEALAKAKS